ncbi:MAG: WecB/TagA/CpsF family glycosyltransferase [Labilithrix sp.]|nr:WecB/TagA/CpsF family glycosyltransferase [Labilithrix sp.]
MTRIDIMGCPFDAVTRAETLERIFAWRDAPVRESHRVAMVNVASLMMMHDDPALARAVERADLVVTEGRPLVWTSRFLRASVPERVSGVALTELLLEEGAARGLSIYLLGSTDDRLWALQRMIFDRYPRVRIAGARNGFFRPSDDWKVVREIRRARADVLLVGMPAPFREVWAEENKERLATPAIVGVGSAFDVLAGVRRRRSPWRYVRTSSAFLARLPATIAQARMPIARRPERAR